MTTRFDWQGVVARVLFSFFAVFAVYNPSGHSWWHWFWLGAGGFWAKLAVTLMLVLLHGLIWGTVIGVLKRRGVLLVTGAIFAGFMAISPLLPDGPDMGGTRLLLLSVLALLYAAGLSYSHIHHRLAGVSHVEQVY
ncbi:DUF6524 family protein [Humitalea sp. 24SJ18S-53]|uniref:DUF6524 family protein n=1 Tax=Humitalea sp. 24SJ18S-53 TaxID=3422307 RepID=UPI003D670A9B